MAWVADLATSWWRGTPTATTTPSPVSPHRHVHALEARAKECEAAGDPEGAMDILLQMHKESPASGAVRLAHELSMRHPDVFESKGCPVSRGGGNQRLPGVAGSIGAVSTTPVAPVDRDGGQSLHSVRRTESASEAAPAPATLTEVTGPDAGGTNVGGEVSPSSACAVGGQQEPVHAQAQGNSDAGEGETPWERGWQGPTSFKPPTLLERSSSNAVQGSRGGTSSTVGQQQQQQQQQQPSALLDSSSRSLRNFTVAQLNAFDGGRAPAVKRGGETVEGKPRPIYIAIKGNVYDASAGRDLYGPGGKYSEFAGHDISRRVAKGVKPTTGAPSGSEFHDENLDDLSLEGLERFEMMTLSGWENTFAARGYPVLGRVVTPPEARKMSREELRPYDGLGIGKGAAPAEYGTAPIYMGVRDRVYDVSFGGSEFYTNDGPYVCLAGRDASRVLAKMSMEREDVQGVLDYSCLTDRERKNIDDWVDKLGEAGKGYPVVGWLDLDSS